MMHIVVEDLGRKYGPGQIVTDADARKLEARLGLTLMPIEESLVWCAGIRGYYKREFGDGVKLPPSTPLHVAPMTLFLQGRPDGYVLHWRARIALCGVPNIPKHGLTGSIRLTGDSSQGIASCGVSQSGQFEFSTLRHESSDEHGWIVGGRGVARATVTGAYGFSLFGVGANLKLVWAALSQE